MKKVCLVDFQDLKTPPIDEIKALLCDLDYEILEVMTFQARQKKFLGKGQIERIAQFVKDNDCFMVYNNHLTGLQYKILDKAFKNEKTLSRIDIIIQVFEKRAMTTEAKLQVRLAKLLHEKAKLVRRWSHLERQRGGTGSIGGPGETQLELDSRMIYNSIDDVKAKLRKIKQDRLERQKGRTDKMVALVGYSNAGKTSLLNKLTDGDANVSSKPFETLDPFARQCILKNQQKIIMADTVGFVTHLPPFLIPAFRSTLENIIHADLLLFVTDSSAEQYNMNQVLQWIKLLKADSKPMIYVWNKVDLIDDVKREYLKTLQFNDVQVSTITGEGIDLLLEKVEHVVSEQLLLEILVVPGSEEYNWLFKYSRPEVIDFENDKAKCRCILSHVNYDRFCKFFPDVKVTRV